MSDIRYCRHCREDIDYSKDTFHYHEPINSRCQVCGAKCYSSMCASCQLSGNELRIEEREMFTTRVKRGNDD